MTNEQEAAILLAKARQLIGIDWLTSSGIYRGGDNLDKRLKEIALCADWIREREIAPEQVRSINARRSSYSYKHWVESWSGRYIANGSFIAAAVGMGFTSRGDSLNLYFNFSERFLKRGRGAEECAGHGRV